MGLFLQIDATFLSATTQVDTFHRTCVSESKLRWPEPYILSLCGAMDALRYVFIKIL